MTIATEANFHAYALIQDAALVHFNQGDTYHRNQLRQTVETLREKLDAVEGFLDSTEPKEDAA